jgi:hypothetical protein
VSALVVLTACSLLYVIIAADRPSLFAPTTHIGYYPGWMAGPLGGLWPGLTRDGTALRYVFTAQMAAMYVSYLLALRYVPRMRRPARWAIATIVAMHVIFFLAPPMALTDVFNYINYGRMEVVHHLNPYTTYPILEPHNDPSYALSNWHELLSPYGPLFTLLTFALVPLGVAGAFWAIKAILVLTSLGLLLLVWRCARMLRVEPVRAVMFVGCNPIVIVWGLGGDHNDFLTVCSIMLGFYLLLRSRAIGPAVAANDDPPAASDLAGLGEPAGEDGLAPVSSLVAAPGRAAELDGRTDGWRGPGAWPARLAGWCWPLSAAQLGAGAALVAATALKASAGILIPIVLVALLRAPRRLTQVLLGMILAGAIVGVASLIAFGVHLPDLGTQSELVTSESIPNLIGLALGAGGETETLHALLTAALGLALIVCCAMVWRRRDAITASGWATVALLVTLGWVLPWYILWLLPLAALSRSRRLQMTALVLGVYLIIAWAPASGLLWSGIGFHPEKTPLGKLHSRYVKELLN